MQNLLEAEKKLREYSQEHILPYLEKLNSEEKQELINQILDIDFEKMKKLYESVHKEKHENEKITPIECIDKSRLDYSKKQELRMLGENVIKNNEYAVITMAGRSRD